MSTRFDTLHRLCGMVDYLTAADVRPLYLGFAPPNIRGAFAVIVSAEADWVQDDLEETDGTRVDWIVYVYGDSVAELEPLALKVIAALNRPGEGVQIGEDRACFCRVTGDEFSTELMETGGEVPRLTYRITATVTIY